MDPRLRGKWGEKVAVDFMGKNNYTVITTGFRSRFGEIDIIAENDGFLIFAEVKTRKNTSFAHAREYVGKAKQNKIIKTANYWLLKRPTGLQPRFDVIEIYAKNGDYSEPPEVIHIKNAFGV